MYTPALKVKKTGVPILSKKEIEVIGENFIRDFCPDALTNPQPIDIDGFVEYYLGMTTDYQYLSHKGIFLGMTVFNDTDKVVVYSPETKRAEYISAKARTIIIDTNLLEDNQEHRYRFTMAHEASHDICHSAFFSYDPMQITFSEFSPMIQCREDNYKYGGSTSKSWSDHDWMEWQANKLGAVLLMPKGAVDLVAQECPAKGVTRNSSLITAVSLSFDVSPQAAFYRLRDLGHINQRITTMQTSILDVVLY